MGSTSPPGSASTPPHMRCAWASHSEACVPTCEVETALCTRIQPVCAFVHTCDRREVAHSEGTQGCGETRDPAEGCGEENFRVFLSELSLKAGITVHTVTPKPRKLPAWSFWGDCEHRSRRLLGGVGTVGSPSPQMESGGSHAAFTRVFTPTSGPPQRTRGGIRED